jgi:hypothetical protein
MAKKMDVKDFLLQKGERLAMGIALFVMIVLIGTGAWSGFSCASPSETAREIREKADRIQTAIRTGPAASPADIDPLLLEKLSNDPVDAVAYATATPNFIASGLEDTKRMAPTVLAPVQFDTRPKHVQVMNYYVNMAGDKIRVGVLVPKDKKDDKGMDVQKYMTSRYGRNMDPRLVAYYQQMAQAYQQQLRMMEQMQKARAQAMGTQPEFTAKPEWSLEFFEAGKVPNGAKMATTVQPYRMVIVSAAFPYKQQLEAFIRALKVDDSNKPIGKIADLYAAAKDGLMPRFTKILVRRRAFDAFGKEVEKWTEIDPRKDIEPVLGQAVSYSPLEPSEEDMRSVVFPGLVLARPKLARGDYPRPKLDKLDDALKKFNDELAKKSGDKTAVMVAAPERRFTGEGIDAFGASGTIDDHAKGFQAPQGPGPGPFKDGPPKGGTDDKDKEKDVVVPEYCLVRFCDVNVKPGLTYQYQMKLQLENPNFGKPEKMLAYPDLAKTKEITGEDWAPKDADLQQTTVTFKNESFYYATELDVATLDDKYRRDSKLKGDKDVAFVQMHRWLDKVRLNPENAASLYPVGDWTVADVPVRRGELIGRTEQVKLPVWFPTREAFDFAVPISTAAPKPMVIGAKPTPGPKGIPVAFSTDDLVVDWEGGKIFQNFKMTEKTSKDVKEDAGVEILVMSPDGTLRVHNSRTDLADPQRKQRYDEWKKALADTENPGRPGGGAGIGPDDPFKPRK